VAWVLAYYAREAKARIEIQSELPALANIRHALEQALGLKFEGDKGEHFFRSSLVQTLFYGIFSAWVLWSKEQANKKEGTRKKGINENRVPHVSPPLRDVGEPTTKFDWRLAQWSLRVPMIRVLFEQIATPGHLGQLDLIEVLDWTASALNRVDRTEFFSRFQEHEAVQYFYEPFLEAFDPELRKELGVWYTPIEIVKYMVARVHTVLREELNLEDGLADPNVYVLDAGCGTGAYLVEVLKTIAATLAAKGKDDLTAQDVKKAAISRVFGFELLPAPFVISHLQLGLLLQNMGAPLADDGKERVGVYLTNSLTGWEPPKGPKQHLIFAEMEAERDAAENVKQHAKILVVIGNPPYNGFAGVGMDEEHALTDAYRETKRAPVPQGQGLNDLYVRFFRVAERKIVEGTGAGIVCLISNYSWLHGMSHTGMRERYMEIFDNIWIDCLNGDAFETGKLTPEGAPDPSVFSTDQNRDGIRIGTAISLLARTNRSKGLDHVQLRNFWGTEKRANLLGALAPDHRFPYATLKPSLELGLPFRPRAVSDAYLRWPTINELFSLGSPGINTSRDLFLVGIDKAELEQRLADYFNTDISDEEMSRISPDVMHSTKRFDATETRGYLRARGRQPGSIIKYCYRPFDLRWLYWEPETKLLDEKRDELVGLARRNAKFVVCRPKAERHFEGTPFYLTTHVGDRHLTRPGSVLFPSLNEPQVQRQLHEQAHSRSENLSYEALKYLEQAGATALQLASHVTAIGYGNDYLTENVDAMRQDWPRIPLPATRDALLKSARLGERVAQLLDIEAEVANVTSGAVREELKIISPVTAAEGGRLDPVRDLLIDAGWGHEGKEGITMPGKGKLIERDYTATEREAIAHGATALGLTPEQAFAELGEKTCDVYLNARAYWKNIPAKVWDYYIGGYQVIKKWLSYREGKLLGRPLTIEEARYVQNMAHRIAALCLLQPELDANYAAVKADTYPWPTSS
jgi:hypothetical protein